MKSGFALILCVTFAAGASLIGGGRHAVGDAGSVDAPDGNVGFVFEGKPVHPLAVEPLVDNLGNSRPDIAGVDLDGSAFDEKVTAHRGQFSAENQARGWANDGKGWFSYRVVGTTPGGLHVLVTSWNGAGSGVFQHALWVKLVRDRVSEQGKLRDRTMIVKVGSYVLGDRDDGEVLLDKENLFIGKSRYREKSLILTLE